MTCGPGDEHAWELRGVTFDARIGTVEDRECRVCGASTFRQAPVDSVVLS